MNFLKLTGVTLGLTRFSGTVTSDTGEISTQGWTTFHHDAGKTGYNPVGDGPGTGAWIAWSEQVSDRRVYALSADDGTELRRFETGGEVEHVAVDECETGDAVYASSDAVYAFR
ncbi:hypothetical protein [Haladaptatus sp. DFWS20]|uniref:hypothetical protein n=1 Tax=Haladaptatus sp. DFWS20 TaxID=3403467 RepID=UPI003EBD1289